MQYSEALVLEELQHYKSHLQGKVVYCNFEDDKDILFLAIRKHLKVLGIKALYATKGRVPTIFNRNSIIYTKGDGKVVYKDMLGNGDYDSPECFEIMRKSDIIISKPGVYSKRLCNHLIRCGKHFIIYERYDRILHKKLIELIGSSAVSLGYTRRGEEDTSRWFTTLPIAAKPLDIGCHIMNTNIKKYDNYDAAVVTTMDRFIESYYEPMGVPLAFIDYYDSKLWHLIGYNTDLKVGGSPCPPKLIVQRRRI